MQTECGTSDEVNIADRFPAYEPIGSQKKKFVGSTLFTLKKENAMPPKPTTKLH